MKTKIRNPFLELSKQQYYIWIGSMLIIVMSAMICGRFDWLSVGTSLLGVTMLIFMAKGDVFAQILTIFFCLLYGAVSYTFSYYGEMITYLGMTLPVCLFTLVSWLRHPYKKGEVKVADVTKRSVAAISVLSVIVTIIFYFILEYFNTPNLFFSTISITTSFFAACLAFLRSPYYALAYGANDIVLVILWVLASFEDISYIAMVACFAVFLFNDIYAFFNWKRMKKRQNM